MARGKIKKHPTEPDVKYENINVSKMINRVMKKGKKTIAKKIVYQALADFGSKTEKNWRSHLSGSYRSKGR